MIFPLFEPFIGPVQPAAPSENSLFLNKEGMA